MNIDNVYAKLDPRLFTKQPPTPLKNPRPGHFNTALAQQLRWPWCDPEQWVSILAGQTVPEGFEPLAMAYAGHQFGQWAGQLGDGRGLLLAQIRTPDQRLIDFHLKGAGQTPYSRQGDGRAVLRSVIREYLAGHALTSLGIASSQALGFVTSDTPVRRESIERGACMLRVADSHVRFGHFEWINRFAPDLLPSFTQSMLQWYYPECLGADQPVLEMLKAIVKRTAQTIADWQLIGFSHGVMNTDNLSITGSTLDFGPYGFMERFEPNWINNHSDYSGRYTYQQQPSIAHWNLSILLSQFLRLGLAKTQLQETLATFEPLFHAAYQKGLTAKMGLTNTDEHFQIGLDFLNILATERLDYTQGFRALSGPWVNMPLEKGLASLTDTVKAPHLSEDFVPRYQAAVQHGLVQTRQPLDVWQQALNSVNPCYILRNHMAQAAIVQAEQDDFSEVERLFTLLIQPYTEQPHLAKPQDTEPPAAHEAAVAISCSS